MQQQLIVCCCFAGLGLAWKTRTWTGPEHLPGERQLTLLLVVSLIGATASIGVLALVSELIDAEVLPKLGWQWQWLGAAFLGGASARWAWKQTHTKKSSTMTRSPSRTLAQSQQALKTPAPAS